MDFPVGNMSHSIFCGFTWTRRTARSSIGRVRWIAFVVHYNSLERHFPYPQRCIGRLRGYPCLCGAASFGNLRPFAIQARTEPSMPGSSTAKRHRDTTNTARIATYARSKRQRSSIQIRVPSSIFTARHTGLTTPRLAIESPFVTPRRSRVSLAIKAMTTNLSGTPSGQRASVPCCATGCSLRTITRTTHGWTASYTASAGWPRPPFRPSSVGSAPLSTLARGTASSANSW